MMKKIKVKKLSSTVKSRKERRIFILFMTKLGLGELNPAGKAILARRIISRMTNNPNFPAPTPTLASLEAAAQTLEEKVAAMDGSKLKLLSRNAAEEALDIKMRQIQGYVESVANNNPSIILSAGMGVRNPNAPIGIVGPVERITIKLGRSVGSVDIKWKPVIRRTMYKVEASTTPDNESSWKRVAFTSKSKTTIEGLESNTIYYFRITCFRPAGAGPKSELFCIRVY
jgi:hypothetical protein